MNFRVDPERRAENKPTKRPGRQARQKGLVSVKNKKIVVTVSLPGMTRAQVSNFISRN